MSKYYKEYIKLKANHIQSIDSEYEQAINKARDKGAAHSKFLSELNKRFVSVQNKLGLHNRLMLDVQEIYDHDNTKEYSEIFNEKINVIPRLSRMAILKDVSYYEALNESFVRIRVKGQILNSHVIEPATNDIPTASVDGDTKPQWKGGETEFVQLIYSLFEAGYLTNNKKAITKLVEEAAKAFSFNLGSYWQQNFSSSINDTSVSYDPEIFENIHQAFNKYRDKRIEKKKKM